MLLASFPATLRICQSYRRYVNDKKKSKTHLLNMSKYFFSLVAVILSSFSSEYLALWIGSICSLVVSTLFSLYWDMVMDWGLSAQTTGTLLLRDRGLLVGGGKRYPYYLLIIANIFLRFTWIFTLRANGSSAPWLLFLVALGEVIRRSVWTLFRLEHEHLNNCGEFKVVHPAEEYGISSLEASEPSKSNEADLFPAI